MGFSSPKPPQIQMPPPSAHPPTLGSALEGMNSQTPKEEDTLDNTIKTSPEGLETPPSTARTTLLGR